MRGKFWQIQFVCIILLNIVQTFDYTITAFRQKSTKNTTDQ